MSTQVIEPHALRDLLHSNPSLKLIDVRTEAEYESHHVPGARCVPLDQLEVERLSRMGLTPETEVYLICKSGSRSQKAHQLLAAKGWHRLVCVEGGTDRWMTAGLPVERSGRKVLPLDRQVQIAIGVLITTGMALGALVHAGFYWVPALIGAGLTFAGLTGFCGLALVLGRMPWNRSSNTGCGSGWSCSRPA